MAKNTEKNDPIRQTADALDKWAARREPKPIEGIGHVSFYGSLLQALDNLRNLVEDWLRDFRPNQLNSIHKDFDELYEEANGVDRLRGEDDNDGEISVMLARAAARRLAERLKLIADTTESYQKQTLIVRHIEDPAETEQKKKSIIWKILKVIVKIIGAIVIGIIVAVVIDVLGDFGWIGKIKIIIYNIFTSK